LKELPQSPNLHGSYAVFLELELKEYDAAERMYLKAISLGDSGLAYLGNYASFLHTARNKYHEAEEFYLRAIAEDPTDIVDRANYVGLLLTLGRWPEADSQAVQAWPESAHQLEQATAELVFYRGLLLSMRGLNDVPALGRLKLLFAVGFTRS